MLKVISETNLLELADCRADLGRVLLDTPYSGIRVIHDHLAGRGEFYRFCIEIPAKEAFHITFDAEDVSRIGQTDEAWARAFLEKVERHLRQQ